MNQKLKILEICPYTSGACGVWARVKQESLELLKKGYEIRVFSSNFDKGTDKIICSEEKIGNIDIRRFPAKKLGGESFMNWNFDREALDYSPDIIIAHNYRHLHTTRALRLVEKLRKNGKKVKIFLVTHAPFVEGNITRSKIQTLIVNLYDKFIGPKTLNKFDKVLAISHWEIPYLIKAGAKKENIIYIPNGIPEEFFRLKKKIKKDEHKILFLSRISPKKKVETLVGAMPLLKDRKIKLELVGPREEDYSNRIEELIDKLNLRSRIRILEPIYELKEKIQKIDSCKIFVLPSRVEGMPQALIEAMSRAKIVIGSNSMAIRDLIQDNKNGYLFDFNNPKSLAEKIDLAIKEGKNMKIGENAKEFAKQFSWSKVINKIEELF